MLLVAPEARRGGVARALMQQAERLAHEAGRTLLTLDARAGAAAEALCRALGWTEAGRIPGCVLDGQGRAHDVVVFCRRGLGSET
ncbi:MAG: GNAT family N-acetyltransferase [Acetobacteraceae bacterium]